MFRAAFLVFTLTFLAVNCRHSGWDDNDNRWGMGGDSDNRWGMGGDSDISDESANSWDISSLTNSNGGSRWGNQHGAWSMNYHSGSESHENNNGGSSSTETLTGPRQSCPLPCPFGLECRNTTYCDPKNVTKCVVLGSCEAVPTTKKPPTTTVTWKTMTPTCPAKPCAVGLECRDKTVCNPKNAAECIKTKSCEMPIAKASCHLQKDPSSPQNVAGTILLSQLNATSPLNIAFAITGFSPVATGSPASAFNHGIHVHAFGEGISQSCSDAGGPYNPFNVIHGGPLDTIRHVGDFGNFAQTADGKINSFYTDKVASLYGLQSIIGRSIVIHAGPDDLGKGGNAASLVDGNSGSRLACCVIGWAP